MPLSIQALSQGKLGSWDGSFCDCLNTIGLNLSEELPFTNMTTNSIITSIQPSKIAINENRLFTSNSWVDLVEMKEELLKFSKEQKKVLERSDHSYMERSCS